MSNPRLPLFPLRVALAALLWLAVIGGLVYLWGFWVTWPVGDFCWQAPVALLASAALACVFDLGRRLLRVDIPEGEEAPADLPPWGGRA
jgi:membrane protein DedA with SNARE-associated domain